MLFKESPSSSSATELSSGTDDELPSPNRSLPGPVTNRAGKRTGETVTVLLAEDRTNIREAFSAYFRPEDGIAVVGQAAHEGDVLRLAEKLRPHVVVMAMRMAVRSGLETIRRILKARWGSELLVLLPNHECPFVGHVAVAGAAGYLTEQDSSPRMAAAIREARGKVQSLLRGGGRPGDIGDTARQKETTRLTPREREALEFIAQGRANKQIAATMGISVKTVEKHRQHLMDKLGIHETATLTRYALYAGFVY